MWRQANGPVASYIEANLYRGVCIRMCNVAPAADIIKPAVTHIAVVWHELCQHCRLMMHRSIMFSVKLNRVAKCVRFVVRLFALVIFSRARFAVIQLILLANVACRFSLAKE